MSNITIHTGHETGFTIIPNHFLDNYMSRANGEFVKIYLYLLRATQFSQFSLSTIADSMNCTEKDVMRALRYWANEGLLSLDYDSSRKLKSISFLEIPATPFGVQPDGANLTAAADRVNPRPKQTEASSSEPVRSGADAVSESTAPVKAPSSLSYQADTSPSCRQDGASASAKRLPQEKALTTDKIRQLKENEDIAQLLFIAEQYLGKTLSPMETGKILYFYEGLDFSTDLIEYLIEYCVGNNHRSINYIEKVALNWKSEGVSTVEDAKKTASGYQKEYYTIFKALGIRNRSPIEAEIKTMKKWLNDFSMELIVEACTRTILTTRQPELSYVNGILESWKNAGARTLQDVRKLDTAHEQAKAEKKAQRSSRGTATKFSNFDQRSYDFSSLESQLLNQ